MPKSFIRIITENYILGIKPMKYVLLPCIIFIIIGSFTEIMLTELIRDVPEAIGSPSKFRMLILEIGIVGLIYTFSSELSGWLISGPLQVSYKKSMLDCLDAYINLDYCSFKQMGVGKILKIMERRSNSTGELIFVVLIQMLPIPFFLIFMSFSVLKEIHFIIYFIILFHLLIYILATILITNQRVKLRKKGNEEINEANNISNEILTNYEGIKAFNSEKYQINRLSNQLDVALHPIIKLWQKLYTLNLSQKIILTSMDVFVLLLFYFQWNNPKITTKPSIIQYFLISNLIRKRLSNLGSIYGTFMIMKTNIKHSCELPKKEITDGKKAAFIKEINVNNLSIRNNKRIFLCKLNFVLKKGEKIALIGSNGSGKTTFIRALLGFYNYEGSLKIDDLELKEISKVSLRNLIAFVPQDSCLMNDTIKENISYGEKITDEEINETSLKYNLNDSFLRLEKGYLTKIGERGKNLSGGEKQKIALLRAAIRKRDLLILDEPTASIDPLAEKEIFDALLKEDATILVIVHNFDLLRLFDKVLHFEDSTAVLYDSFDDFSKKNGDQINFYKHMALSSDKINEEDEF